MLKETAASNLSITGCNRIKHITFACQMFLLSSISRSLFIILKSDCITVKPLFELSNEIWVPGADLGFLERGFMCINVLGFALLIKSHFS